MWPFEAVSVNRINALSEQHSLEKPSSSQHLFLHLDQWFLFKIFAVFDVPISFTYSTLWLARCLEMKEHTVSHCLGSAVCLPVCQNSHVIYVYRQIQYLDISLDTMLKMSLSSWSITVEMKKTPPKILLSWMYSCTQPLEKDSTSKH